MKKLKILGVVAITSTLFLMTGCVKKKSCSELANDYTNAYLTFIQNMTQQNCEDAHDAAREYLDNCTPADRQSIQDAIDNEDCSQLP